jgi:DNA-binding transcriptional LysR family regulator
MNDLEVRQLRYFVAVAEELHFGRAAERLTMAQPPLSRAIRDLERQLDVSLLERTTRQVRLTAAGEVLLRDARTALDAIAAADRRTRHAGRAEPSLRLAFKADYDAGLLPQILAAYQREEAALPVEFVLGGRDEQMPALRDGRADVALVFTPMVDRDLDGEPLLTEPRVVALAASDPLAGRASLRLADLAGRTQPDGTPADLTGHNSRPPPGPSGRDTRSAAGNPSGHAPRPEADPSGRDSRPVAVDLAAQGSRTVGADGRHSRPVTDREVVTGVRPGLDLAQIFNLVELGGIVLFAPVSMARRHARPGIVYRPVSDLLPVTLAVVWPRESHSPAVAAFVRAALDVASAARQDDSHQAEVA